jgi:hypothetical protein
MDLSIISLQDVLVPIRAYFFVHIATCEQSRMYYQCEDELLLEFQFSGHGIKSHRVSRP